MAPPARTKRRPRRDTEAGAQRIDRAIENARRYYDIKTLSLAAVIDLYGHLGRFMPKSYKNPEFRAAARIQRAIYQSNLRLARRQAQIVRRFKSVASDE